MPLHPDDATQGVAVFVEENQDELILTVISALLVAAVFAALTRTGVTN